METTVAEVTGKLIVTVNGEDRFYDLSTFDINLEMTDREIYQSVVPSLRESFPDITFEETYKLRRARNSGNIHLIPNPEAGI